MNLEHIVNQQIAEASLRIHMEIERAAWGALSSLGLQASFDGIALAKKKMKEESPLYVKTIALRGQMCRDMYDDHPGHTYFYSDATQSIEAPPYCPLSKAMQISLQMLEAGKQKSDLEEEYDGQFCPASIVLMDQFGNTIQEYSERYIGEGRHSAGWMEELPPQENWAAMEEQIKALNSEGSFETGWDNFETGRRLHAHADSLRRKIEMAKSRSRIIS